MLRTSHLNYCPDHAEAEVAAVDSLMPTINEHIQTLANATSDPQAAADAIRLTLVEMLLHQIDGFYDCIVVIQE